MGRVAGEITIARPIEEVFDFVADARNELRYNPPLRRSDKVTNGPVGVGTRFAALHHGHRFPFEMTITVTDYDRPHRLGWTRSTPPAEIRGTLTFETVTGGTRLRWNDDIQFFRSARLLGPVGGAIGREERTCWEGLKHYLESEEHRGTTTVPASPAR
jgi:uncharacterized protein YndB with AHSA1/START domain